MLISCLLCQSEFLAITLVSMQTFRHYAPIPIGNSCLAKLQAIKHYEQAADYYKGEESNRLVWKKFNNCSWSGWSYTAVLCGRGPAVSKDLSRPAQHDRVQWVWLGQYLVRLPSLLAIKESCANKALVHKRNGISGGGDAISDLDETWEGIGKMPHLSLSVCTDFLMTVIRAFTAQPTNVSWRWHSMHHNKNSMTRR